MGAVQPVISRFINSARSRFPDVEVLCVQSVQNQRLYARYMHAKQSMRLSGQLPNEKFLWHGTCANQTMDSIVTQGFRKEFTTHAKFGEGTYFAQQSAYSVGYSASQRGRSGTIIYNMFYCQVLCGVSKFGRESIKLKTWPRKQNGQICDSLMGRSNGSAIYVIHDDARAYPLFVVWYKGRSVDEYFKQYRK